MLCRGEMAVNCKNCVKHLHCVDGMHSSDMKPTRKAHSLLNLFVLALFIYLFISIVAIFLRALLHGGTRTAQGR